MPIKQRRRPLYPLVAAAAAIALSGLACGPGLDEQTQQQNQQLQLQDAGSQPRPNDFIGGAMPVEMLPDGGYR